MNNRATTGIYSEREMKAMIWFHGLKERLFMPIIWGMTRLGITANFLSVFGGILVFVSLLASVYFENGLWFIWGLWLHMFLDGFDGTLARYQKKSCDLGSYIDVIADHVGIVSASVFLYFFVAVDFVPLFLYTIFYTLVVSLAFPLGKIGRPYKYVLRPRLIMYAALTYDFIWSEYTSNWLLYLLMVVLGVSVIEGLWRVGKYLKSP